jgi:acetylornithine deacetylase/succinyl-diaminopimelate desuccinylase-like protein
MSQRYRSSREKEQPDDVEKNIHDRLRYFVSPLSAQLPTHKTVNQKSTGRITRTWPSTSCRNTWHQHLKPSRQRNRNCQVFQNAVRRQWHSNEIFEYKPTRANIIARLKGNGTKKPIILLSHMDVVTADPSAWEVDPFSAEIRKGSIYGRGALDMKSEGLLHLMTMLILKQQNIQLSRDVIFIATADEEVKDEGSIWMIANKSDLFKDAEYLITEGGDNLLEGSAVRYVGVDVAEKAPFWLQLTATGQPGHGSRPISDSATNRLVRAMSRIINWETAIKLLPAVEKFFKDVAPCSQSQCGQVREHPGFFADPGRRTTAEREYNFLLRNTISLTCSAVESKPT